MPGKLCSTCGRHGPGMDQPRRRVCDDCEVKKGPARPPPAELTRAPRDLPRWRPVPAMREVPVRDLDLSCGHRARLDGRWWQTDLVRCPDCGRESVVERVSQ